MDMHIALDEFYVQFAIMKCAELATAIAYIEE